MLAWVIVCLWSWYVNIVQKFQELFFLSSNWDVSQTDSVTHYCDSRAHECTWKYYLNIFSIVIVIVIVIAGHMNVPENITWIFSQLKLAPSLKQPAFCASGFLECLFQICSHVTFVFQYYQAQFCQNNAILLLQNTKGKKVCLCCDRIKCVFHQNLSH